MLNERKGRRDEREERKGGREKEERKKGRLAGQCTKFQV